MFQMLRFPCSPWGDSPAPAAQGDHGERRDPAAARGGAYAGAGGCLGEAVTPWETH